MLTVGAIVEGVSPGFADTTGAADSGEGYDFAINDLLFKMAINDTNPYQRATAQFRKDQYDTGSQSGDQSLTGWWTRGQFSFHKGAGVTYYEVSEGDTVLSRYREGVGVDPFRPGAVTAQRSWTPFTNSASAEWVGFLNGYIVLQRSQTIRYGVTSASDGTELITADLVQATAVGPGDLGFAGLANGEVISFDNSGTITTLYTGLTNIRGVWYVKSRLVVQDGDGKWYQLAAAPMGPPIAVAPTDVIFTAADWSGFPAQVCDTPGPILIADVNRIFALTLDATGTIPTFSAPVQVGELPPAEYMNSMVHHLGFIILATSEGVRIAVLSDSGQLTYGPQLVERDSEVNITNCLQIARYGTRVCLLVDARLVEIDLSQQVGTGLEFAWTYRGDPDPTTAVGGYGGLVTIYSGSSFALVLFAGDGMWVSEPDAAYAEGSITTGYHRFATLENKRFDTVIVHASGAHGTVGVSRVSAEGTETFLYNVDVAQVKVQEIPLRLTDGEEAIGLKFTLTPDPAHMDETPTLLGYQLKAQPEPKRQRMIRVPLMIYDIERRQPGQAAGRQGSGAERLFALESLEETRSIVNYQDFRTGESARAYFESVEFTNPTPPSKNSSGFGGTAFVTLRRI